MTDFVLKNILLWNFQTRTQKSSLSCTITPQVKERNAVISPPPANWVLTKVFPQCLYPTFPLPRHFSALPVKLIYARLSSEHQLHQEPFAAAWSAGFTVLPDGWGQCVKLSTLPLIHNSAITFPWLWEIDMKCKCEYLERESRLGNSFTPARTDSSETIWYLIIYAGMLLSLNQGCMTKYPILEKVGNEV